MPSTKLTWKRLKDHLRKYLWAYIIGGVIAVVLSDLLYTMVSPRTPEEKIVRFYIVEQYTDSELFTDDAQILLENLQAAEQDILGVYFEPINFADAESDYYSSMLLMVRIAGADGDVFLCDEKGYNYMTGTEVALPLDEYLADGWLQGIDAEPVTYTNEETGESYVAAVLLKDAEKLRAAGFYNDEIYVCVAVNGTNIESSMMATEDYLGMITE